MADKPNIVLLMTDQQRADFFAGEGGLDTQPFVEGLGRQGARFAHAYTPMPACAPARVSTFTGRFPKATHVRQNSAAKNVFRPDGLPDLADLLRARGYSVNLCGKNHTYLTGNDFDFAAFYMHTGGGRRDGKTEQEAAFDAYLLSLDHGVAEEPTPFPLSCQLPWRIVRDAIECVGNRDRDKPFFLWLSFPEPHNPYQVPEPYFSLFPEEIVPERLAGAREGAAKGPKWRWMQRLIAEKRPGYDARWRRYRANYCGMLRLLDDQIKRFVGHLDATGERDDTLLVFCSDHGDFAGDYGLQRKGVEMPECLLRVPLLFNGPGIAPRKVPCEEFVSLVDILPTLCEAIGADIPYGVQGRSLWPLLTGRDYDADAFRSIYAEHGFGGLPYGEHERPPLHFPYDGPSFDELNSVTQSGSLKMVRKGRWKLFFDNTGRGELYDLETDPAEMTNLWNDPDHREVRREMVEELLLWTIRTEDDLPGGAYLPKRRS